MQVLHLGRTNHNYTYTLDGNDLQHTSAMKDLRIIIYIVRECKSHTKLLSGVASLDLMLWHTSFYNTPCLTILKYSLATSMLVHTCIYLWLLFEKCIVQLAMAMLV